MAQIVADELGVDAAGCHCCRSDLDTLNGPWSITSGNYSNRFSAVVTSAVALAARKGAAKLRAVAARMLGVSPERGAAGNGMASAPGGRNEPIPDPPARRAAALGFEQLARRCRWAISETVEFSPPCLVCRTREDRLASSLTYNFQCDLAAVEVESRDRSRACAAICQRSTMPATCSIRRWSRDRSRAALRTALAPP